MFRDNYFWKFGASIVTLNFAQPFSLQSHFSEIDTIYCSWLLGCVHCNMSITFDFMVNQDIGCFPRDVF